MKIFVHDIKKNIFLKSISQDLNYLQLEGNFGIVKKYLRKDIKVIIFDNFIILKPFFYHKRIKMLLNSYFFILKNTIVDLNYGFFVLLEIRGIGFKVYLNSGLLIFNLGFSHKIFFELPKNIISKVLDDKNTIFYLMGNDRTEILSTAIKICSLKIKDPYKGKGIYFFSAIKKLKEGKGKKKI